MTEWWYLNPVPRPGRAERPRVPPVLEGSHSLGSDSSLVSDSFLADVTHTTHIPTPPVGDEKRDVNR
jgi:hypothetical protein